VGDGPSTSLSGSVGSSKSGDGRRSHSGGGVKPDDGITIVAKGQKRIALLIEPLCFIGGNGERLRALGTDGRLAGAECRAP